MIEGIKADFTMAELYQHLETRVHYHNLACLQEEEMLATLPPDIETKEETDLRWDHDTARQRIERRIRTHRRKAHYMTVVAAHLVAGEVYRLDPGAMYDIEVAEEDFD
jgi:hypothetical protein